jgi:hypothetical protein
MGGAAAAPQRAAPAVVARAPEPGRSHRRVQTALKISNPNDAAEREAEATAKAVMAMPDPAVTARARVPMLAARAPAPAPAPKAKTDETSPELTAAIKSELGRGRQLPNETRKFLEPRFRANFAGVRIHTDGKAENLATRLGARAFAYGRDVFFNAGAFNPDSPDGMELIAHELTHTIQQQEVVQREVQVTQRSEPQVQRGVVSEALDWIADKANIIPGFRLFTIVIGRNPINMSKVERSGANILRALIEFIPGGGLIVQALENHGIFEKGGKFIEDQFAALGDLGGALRDALMEFVNSLGVRDIFRLGSLWDRAKRIFTVPVDKAISFGKNLVSGIAAIVKEAIIKPLGRWAAANIPKWDLLVGVFGKNPISDEGESPASALIGGFMELIGQKEIWENIKKGNAVAKAWQWFQGAMKGALGLVTSIPGRVMGVIRSLTIFDIVTIAGAFGKIFSAFASFVGDFMRWAGGTVLQLLEIILSVVAPTVVPYLKKAGGAFSTIIKNPVGFVRTLVRAGIMGFRQFASNFLTHLKAALIQWLTGSLGGLGVYIPQGFTLLEILKFVLSVMGLTWANIRAKLVAATNETVVKALETGFDIVMTLVTEGPAAAWQKIVETLTNLKQMAIDAIMDFVKSKVVEAAVTKLLSMLSPAGAFIQAIIAIYNTIMFFVERIRQIAQVAASFIDGIAAIAAGNIAPAANRVEQTMAGLLVLVISFLARIAGLGKVSDAVVGLVKKLRAPIDKALDKVVAWLVATAKKLGKMVMGENGKPDPAAKGGAPADGELGETVSFSAGEEGHRIWIAVRGEDAQLMLASSPKPLSVHLSEFKGDAKSLDPPEKAKALAAISAATPIAKRIEANAKKAAKKVIGTADRETLDTAIEADEKLVRPPVAEVLNLLKVRVPAETEELAIVFVRAPGLDASEYTRQLGQQQSGINAMMVADWIARRMQYAERKAQEKKDKVKKPSGRDKRGDPVQRATSAAARTMLIQRMVLPEKATGAAVAAIAADPYLASAVAGWWSVYSDTTRRKGLALSTATNLVEVWLTTQNALHSPDQVAGGRFDQITGMGAADVNQDIGANWGQFKKPAHLANQLQDKAKASLRKLKVSQAFWRLVKMKCKLT